MRSVYGDLHGFAVSEDRGKFIPVTAHAIVPFTGEHFSARNRPDRMRTVTVRADRSFPLAVTLKQSGMDRVLFYLFVGMAMPALAGSFYLILLFGPEPPVRMIVG